MLGYVVMLLGYAVTLLGYVVALLGYVECCLVTWSFFTYGIQEEREWLELTQCSLISCDVYEFHSVVSMDASRRSVFVKDWR